MSPYHAARYEGPSWRMAACAAAHVLATTSTIPGYRAAAKAVADALRGRSAQWLVTAGRRGAPDLAAELADTAAPVLLAAAAADYDSAEWDWRMIHPAEALAQCLLWLADRPAAAVPGSPRSPWRWSPTPSPIRVSYTWRFGGVDPAGWDWEVYSSFPAATACRDGFLASGTASGTEEEARARLLEMFPGAILARRADTDVSP